MGLVATVLNVEESDLAGLPLSVLAAMATIGSYYYLQPLGDVLALSMGIEWTPLVTVGNMVLIVALNPLYAAAVLNLSTEAILPFMYRIVSALLLLFACFFYFFSGVKTLSFCFSVYVGTISLFTTTTFYARLASLHTKAEAKRVYGIIAAGAQIGQLLASVTAPIFFSQMGNMIVCVSALTYELAVQPTPEPAENGKRDGKRNGKHCEVTPSPEPATSAIAENTCASRCGTSAVGGFAILASTPFLRAITLHTLLITFLVSGVWYERAAAVAAAFRTSDERYEFFAHLNFVVGVCTLLVQLLCFSHILRWLGFHGTLVAEPLAMGLGLCISIVSPGLLSIAFLDGLRKVVHYSLAKPTKEGLYASLPKDVVFIAKPLLDTLVYRTGSLVGAAYFTAAIQWGLTAKVRQYMLLAVSIGWAANCWWLGILAERHQQAQEELARLSSVQGGQDSAQPLL
ncbi:major facilitator superfamily mfs_1 [Chrysochromulina tobinii]|uniref:Major facilitator superfamily mfs_1 n=1 Tax=Chrysochromulina tobinii TaxID=1460289 RepID=A0A0M0JMK8_9EUKA|nr:major facilitator superfamily mfs_1 [Chrysochromulina tobinii]|eukprot:KOO27537.1 major facilitator superfamily mfs_1 [Chrysochromulina sp. CCMP291]